MFSILVEDLEVKIYKHLPQNSLESASSSKTRFALLHILQTFKLCHFPVQLYNFVDFLGCLDF